MKQFSYIISTIFLLCICKVSFATHIAGGEIFYEYISSPDANTNSYKVTMRLFRECNSGGQSLDQETVTLGVYNADLSLYRSVALARQWTSTIPTLQNTPGSIPCLTNAITICYQIGEFSAVIDLPKNPDGFVMAWIRYTRTSLQNVTGSFVGATFTTRIPGTNAVATAINNSAKFVLKDTAIICKNKNFSLDYSATDVDGDSLAYKFVDGFDGINGSSNNPNPGPQPTLFTNSLQYINPFTGNFPLGPLVTINATTGRISGTAPSTPGKYVIVVGVEEWRNGKKLNEHRKDLIITIGDCDYTEANLNPNSRTFCKTFDYAFQNGSSSSSILGYHWDFGVSTTFADTSNQATPSFTYPDTGVYKVMLTVFGPNGCNATDSLTLAIFPGFTANFDAVGSCFINPYQFTDRTVTSYGTVSKWRWDFGDNASTADTSNLRNPSFTFPSSNTYAVTLIAENSKNCRDTITKNIFAKAQPTINLGFKDTLICSVDTVQLQANSPGSISWSPNTFITNTNVANPQVFPKDTTQYIVTSNENGCINKDTVTINVLEFITVKLPPDTTVCLTDTFIVKTVSEALQYTWSPPTGLFDTNIKRPILQAPLGETTYQVIANLGYYCADTATFKVKAVPYPSVKVTGADTVCFGFSSQLNATIVGTSFSWSPTVGLINPTTLTPIAQPNNTTLYTLTVTDVLGCPKPVRDTVRVTVVPPVRANAGRDTSVVINQPLTLTATGGNSYSWSPSTGLNNPLLASPTAILGPTIDSIKYLVTVTTIEGCQGTDDIKVKVYKTAPELFVPSGFTPNNDTRNDVLKVIPVGIKQLNYFRIYNRWGQLIFQTNTETKGWDGRVYGIPQASGTYVFMAEGTDYLNNVVFRKGTTVLIR